MNAWARLVLRARLRRKPHSLTLQHGRAAGKTMTIAHVSIPVRNTSKGVGRNVKKVFHVRLVAWGEMADQLAEHAADEMVEVAGQLRYSEFLNRDGTLEKHWECALERLTSSRLEEGKEGGRGGEKKEGKESIPAPIAEGGETPGAGPAETTEAGRTRPKDIDDLDDYLDELLAEAKAAAAEAQASGDPDPEDDVRADVQRLLAEKRRQEGQRGEE